ncbi:type II toxin-antitoxin system VapC family toxin [Polaromonas sp. CG_9.11]|uniref:type II toxin-antitoxin system VapC family toxin n=1 Tax=Polaromonas sp. CG_9.11 TaxID=2787730 RepID=UPI0018CA0974|nr:PIN domain-containing protein [Polaromonas sp. CG_9.11]MBG6074702.1 putative nucleic acid-binding protein [Polaromonas sp. CG_9.11]
MSSHLILDTGPWVALHCRDDAHHEWAKTQFSQHEGPFLTCEAVVAETCFLLARSGFDPGKALALIERGVVRVAVSLADQATAVRTLFERYDNVPASLADACLVRMSELYEPCRVMTLDSDFRLYRRHGRKVIPILTPRA